MKYIVPVLFFSLVLGLSSCNKNDDEVEIPAVVINELLPKNSQNGSDQDGEYDDWIELYNPSEIDQDISGYYLSDSKKEPGKWKFPEGTVIGKLGYLIVWCDGDTLQAGLHTNYRLSADGENVVFLDPELNVIDLAEYPVTVVEQSWARKPNGSGDFAWSAPTFNRSNE
ncbi:lamin tail domain-containing protein [Maribellus sediminis]|uniref:lamin tail domain-containing protein n=1 Tax=Maribellus sediminis TaxID=2696285 RepID=UPI00142FBC1F|nr:lamin tail domain-containing protein [Maribellus sediminis]